MKVIHVRDADRQKVKIRLIIYNNSKWSGIQVDIGPFLLYYNAWLGKACGSHMTIMRKSYAAIM